MPYMNVTEVESAIAALSAAHPGLCELITLPNNTHEGRTSHAVRVGQGPLDNRPAVLFIGGQHAREWGSCEILVNVAADLLEAKRREQSLDWMDFLLEEGLRQWFYGNAAIRSLLPDIRTAVAAGKLSPTAAADRLLDYLREINGTGAKA